MIYTTREHLLSDFKGTQQMKDQLQSYLQEIAAVTYPKEHSTYLFPKQSERPSSNLEKQFRNPLSEQELGNFYTHLIAHELGHLLGLEHPKPYDYLTRHFKSENLMHPGNDAMNTDINNFSLHPAQQQVILKTLQGLQP